MKFYVVAYDIRDDKRRARVAQRLEQAGVRVQESVFELPVSRAAELRCLRKELTALTRPEDNLRFYRLCPGCRQDSTTLEGHPIAQVPGFVLV